MRGVKLKMKLMMLILIEEWRGGPYIPIKR